MPHILAIDDEKAVLNLIKLGLSDYEVSMARDGESGLEAARKTHPDIILLDITMPGIDGFEVCRRLRSDATTASIPVIFLTAKGGLNAKMEGFEAGADDYVVKPFDIQELDMRVRAVLRRAKPSVMADELNVGDLHLNVRTREASTTSRKELLTPTEFSLLAYLMRHPDEILSTQQLLTDVWGYPWGTGDPALVRMHVRNLRLKLEEDPAEPQRILTMGRQGYTVHGV